MDDYLLPSNADLAAAPETVQDYVDHLEAENARLRALTEWQPIEYTHDSKGTITLPKDAPFDGEPVLIQLGAGVVEARWMDWEPHPIFEDPNNGEGWCWVCLDDSAPPAELDDVTHWLPLPSPPTEDG